MERDCMLAQGTSRFLKERLFECSDPYDMYICNNCGNISASTTECHVCDNDTLIQVNCPYAAKLVFQELMGIGLKINLQGNDETNCPL